MYIEIEMDAVPQGRVRFYRGVAVDPEKSRRFKREIALQVKLKGYECYETALKVEIVIFRKYRATSRRYGDIDNLAKGILDGLTGVMWKDDAQIVELNVRKEVSKTPRILLKIEEKRNE